MIKLFGKVCARSLGLQIMIRRKCCSEIFHLNLCDCGNRVTVEMCYDELSGDSLGMRYLALEGNLYGLWGNH